MSIPAINSQLFMSYLEKGNNPCINPVLHHFVLTSGFTGKQGWIRCSNEFLPPHATTDSDAGRVVHDLWVRRVTKPK
jgi:hypothetical protein